MEKISLEAEIRQEAGKSAIKKLRLQDLIPAVVYRAGEKATNLKISRPSLLKALHTEAGENVIINLKLFVDRELSSEEESGSDPKSSPGDNVKTVIIKEIQYHPVKGSILHIDFSQISLKEKLTVDVPVGIKGDSQGVKEGGILEHTLWELKVECLPTKIPEQIEVDVTDLKIGDFIHVKELAVPQDIKILSDPEAIVVSVKPPVVEKEEEEAAEGESAEPEVITEKKKDEPEESGKGQEGKKE